jgi:ribose transport system substrate-binding protein
MKADPFIEPINSAIAGGTEVVTFAADSPDSNRTSYVTSDNRAEAAFAAEEIVKVVGESGEYAVLENPGQSNHDLRVTAFIDYMETNYPDMELVGRQATNQDVAKATQATASILQANPGLDAMWIPEAGSAEGAAVAVLEADADVLILHADITAATLDFIKDGTIHMSLNPNQGIQGYMGFVTLFMAAHPDLIDPFNDWEDSGFNPAQVPFIDNGFSVITKDNTDSFVLGEYMEGRSTD